MDIEMVCIDDDKKNLCRVIDTLPNSNQEKISIVVRPNLTVDKVYKNIQTLFNYTTFDLVLGAPNGGILLNDKRNSLLYDVSGFEKDAKNTLIIMPTDSWMNTKKKIDDTYGLLMEGTNHNTFTPDSLSDSDLALGASASPTEPETIPVIPRAPALPMYETNDAPSTSYKLKLYSASWPSMRYVGLVNQAMTCYLNSLLQALFMTPEFRNALYNWEFDAIDEAKSIPYQLQKLFLNLQTSQKVAVETTDLTKSFGWDSTEAWQQHDIQELCRVMFDALERKFKDTEQADLINRLYEGKMMDYVKCLECCTEKSREDTFLDIPLPVRPFGSAVAYGSIEEALRAFVQPETLDGNNQYFCEKCNKKCDAHKGLKFKKFPYILTLHLKRFDFDYQTLHRIKLNDKVTFPQTLNLNSFVNATDVETFGQLQNNNHTQINGFTSSPSSEHDTAECLIKCDDSITTDSGAVLEEDNCSGIATTASSSHNDNDLQEDDEGIDMSTSTDNRMNSANDSGPCIYELFAIMIHSGSASGGHYYAYIKEFDNGEWYCFNDQTVSTITQEDIQKSFGGGSFKAYYSGVYSSSTNAYMLMYRQMDPKLNATAMKATEFPEHITNLVKRLDDKEQEDKKQRASEPDIIKPKVYFYNPKLRTIVEQKIFISKCCPLESALETAHSVLGVDKFAPLSRCRLVAYDYISEEIVQSLEGRDQEPIGTILDSLRLADSDFDFLLEIRTESEEFEKYEPGGVTTKIFKVDMKTSDVDGPYFVRAPKGGSVTSFKKIVAKKLKLKSKELVLALATYSSGIVVPKDTEIFFAQRKVFVTSVKKPTPEIAEEFAKIAEDFIDLMYLYVTVPKTNKETLEAMAIPPYIPRSQQPDTPKQSASDSKQLEGGDVVDAVMLSGASNLSSTDLNHIGASGDFKRSSPLPPHPVENGCGGESNSEDSSLSDGDRTLVESVPHDLSHASSPSHSPQLSSPEDESGEKPTCRLPIDIGTISDDEDFLEIDSSLYFRVIPLEDEVDLESDSSTPHTNGNLSDTDENATSTTATTTKDKVQREYTLKIIVNKLMKLGSFKRALEPHIKLPCEYFKIVQKQSNDLKHDYTDLLEKLKSFKDGDCISIELGRNLKRGEHKAKIYYLKLSEITNEIGKLPIVCDWFFKVGIELEEVKRELIAHLQKLDINKYQKLNMENCRLWEKSGKNPLRILPGDKKLMVRDLGLSINCEMVLQECENGTSPVTSEQSLTLFVRRWHPSTLTLDTFQEVTLEKNSEVRKLLSDISDIPEDKVAYSRVNSSFPCTNISLLNINSSMSWFTNAATAENYPIYLSQDGAVYFYKNSTELPKELTIEERRELQVNEKARLERIGGASTSIYSPRRERALKIYLDSSPKARDE